MAALGGTDNVQMADHLEMSADLPIEDCNGSEVKWSHDALTDRKTSK